MSLTEYKDNFGSVTFDRDALCCVVQIPPGFTSPDQIRILGTAFHLGLRDCVVTAQHIFHDSDMNFGPYFVLRCGDLAEKNFGNRLALIEDMRTHGASDLTILRVKCAKSAVMTPFLVGNHELLNGADLFTIGYTPSLSAVTPKQWKCHLAVNRCRLVGIEERERANVPTEFSLVFQAPFAEGGNSGGPVLDNFGRVVGVFSQICANVHATNEDNALVFGRATSTKPFVDIAVESPIFREMPRPFVDWFTGTIRQTDMKSLNEKVTAEDLRRMESILRREERGLP